MSGLFPGRVLNLTAMRFAPYGYAALLNWLFAVTLCPMRCFDMGMCFYPMLFL